MKKECVRASSQIELLGFTIMAPVGVWILFTQLYLYLIPHYTEFWDNVLFFSIGIWLLLWVALLAYWLRENMRLVSGILEFSIAFAVAYLSFMHMIFDEGIFDEHFAMEQSLSSITQIAGAIYVMVRGYDSIGRGLKSYPKADMFWQWFSLQPTRKRYDYLCGPNGVRYPWMIRTDYWSSQISKLKD